MNFKARISVKVRRYDLSENPQVEEKTLILSPHPSYEELKQQIFAQLNVANQESKVIKIRNKDYALVCVTQLLESKETQRPYTVDISKVIPCSEKQKGMLQDAYLDAVRQKLEGMQSRVTQAEDILLPQLQWRREAHLDDTVSKLSARVAFLSRRIDELTPPEWKNKIPESIS